MKPNRAVHSVDEAAAILGLDPRTVRAGIRDHQLPGFIVKSRYLIPVDALNAFLCGDWQAPQNVPTQFMGRKRVTA